MKKETQDVVYFLAMFVVISVVTTWVLRHFIAEMMSDDPIISTALIGLVAAYVTGVFAHRYFPDIYANRAFRFLGKR